MMLGKEKNKREECAINRSPWPDNPNSRFQILSFHRFKSATNCVFLVFLWIATPAIWRILRWLVRASGQLERTASHPHHNGTNPPLPRVFVTLISTVTWSRKGAFLPLWATGCFAYTDYTRSMFFFFLPPVLKWDYYPHLFTQSTTEESL